MERRNRTAKGAAHERSSGLGQHRTEADEQAVSHPGCEKRIGAAGKIPDQEDWVYHAGGSGETRQTVLESLAFADSLGLESVKVTVGIRIYPGTFLARHARRTGAVAGDDALLFPKFYVEAGMEGWIRKTVEAWISDRPGWIF